MAAKPRRVWCTTLGCDKNLVDSEALLGRFAVHGFTLVEDPEQAEVWVVNSCGFIDAARRDSAETVADLASAKGDRTLVVTGCWAQEHAERIGREFPGVDLVGGVGQFDELIAAVADRTGSLPLTDPNEARYAGLIDRPLLTPSHVAFVKIGEGCNCHCTFCRIPLIRGKLRSRSVAEIESEVRGLVARGVTEVQLVSQNTSDFGRDSGENLLDLVVRLDRIEPLRRIRLLYLYAGLLTAEMALALLEVKKLVPYLDLPIQHASHRLLTAMRRPGDPVVAERFFATLRRARPDVVLRTTALLGFPGEEEADVEQLLDFMARVEFDHLGTYRYSPEVGTPAAALDDLPDPEEVADREARVLDLQAEISLRRQSGRLGQTFEVVVDAVAERIDSETELPTLLRGLAEGQMNESAERSAIERVIEQGGPVAVGRSHHFAYDLDGVVIMPAAGLRQGDWLDATWRAVTPFDVWAVPVTGDIGADGARSAARRKDHQRDA